MVDQEIDKREIGSFESFRITKKDAGILWLGIEVQDELVTQYYDRKGGFTATRTPTGKPRVVYNVGRLRREVEGRLDINDLQSVKAVQRLSQIVDESASGE